MCIRDSDYVFKDPKAVMRNVEKVTRHINTTYKATYRKSDGTEDSYILQRINDYVCLLYTSDGRIRSAQAGIFKHAGHFSGNAGAVALMEPHGIPFLHLSLIHI